MSGDVRELSRLVYCASTDPTTGRFNSVEVALPQQDVLRLFDALTGSAGGYMEARRADAEYPLLAVSTHDGYFAVHWFVGAKEVSLLDGDGALDESARVELPVFEETAVFSGAHVVARDTARLALTDFMSGEAARPPGGWTTL